MSGIKMWACLYRDSDLELAALFRLEKNAQEHRLAWHGDNDRTLIRPIFVQFLDSPSPQPAPEQGG